MDFIMTWVDGNDPQWRKELNQYKKTKKGEKEEARFRDWENLHFWFRGIEKFAPWVDNIHFVTWGHLPKWLNTEHPKLNIIKHEDYIPKEYLPTFNSRTIDLNFHRIEELSDEYVYFNDDTFIIDVVKETDFFKAGKPCDMAQMKALSPVDDYNLTFIKDIMVVNRNFSKYKAIRSKPFNWFNLRYGLRVNVVNFLLSITNLGSHTGFYNHHLAHAQCKKIMKSLWEKEYDEMHKACGNKFRNHATVNQYLERFWHLASNQFYPVNLHKLGRKIPMRRYLDSKSIEFIKTQKKPLVCLNDYSTLPEEEFLKAKKEIIAVFETIFPEKSTFEI